MPIFMFGEAKIRLPLLVRSATRQLRSYVTTIVTLASYIESVRVTIPPLPFVCKACVAV